MSERSYGQIWPIGEDGKPLERTPMTNDAERVSDIVAELRANATAYAAVGVMDTSALLSKAASIIEAQSKALAEARVVLSDVNDLLNYIDDHGHMLKREWTPELRERVWSFADRIPPLLPPTPENPNG